MVGSFRSAAQGTLARSGAERRDLARTVDELGCFTLLVADHHLGAGPAARAASLPPQHLAPSRAPATTAAPLSTVDQAANGLLERRETVGVHDVSFQQCQVQTFVPIAARLIGR
jgi:hypothetical protein